jgi:DNA mismatch repair protein MSH4
MLIILQSGVSGLLDVARQTFKEATEDVHQHVTDINREFKLQIPEHQHSH